MAYDDSKRANGKGPMVMKLTPHGHNAHVRTEFRIHGDSIDDPGNASTGCIVLGPVQRKTIANSGDITLEVTE